MWTGIKARIGAIAAAVASTVERRLGVVLGVLVVGMVGTAAVFLRLHGTDEPLVTDAATASLRNLFLVIVAVIGVPLAIWRSAVAKQQANASDRQAETAERRLKNELYEKGAEMLGAAVPSVRLGGIYSLKGLMNANPEDYRDQVMELLCAFVRDPPDERGSTSSSNVEEWPNPEASPVTGTLRDDVQTAMNLITRRRDEPEAMGHWGEHRQLDLRGATLEWLEAEARDLNGAILHGVNLNGARLAKAGLRGAEMATGSMNGADVPGVDLSGAAISSVDMRRLSANDADLSKCRLNGVELGRAVAIGAKFSSSGIHGSSFTQATLQRAKLDGCHLTDTDFSGASLWRADLSGANFGVATRVTTSPAGTTRVELFCKLTQAQLDEALAHPDHPPTLDGGIRDAETDKPLVWRGGCISEDQYPLVHAPQQIVEDGTAARMQGCYFEWQDLNVRFVPGIVERLDGRELGRKWREANETLGNSQLSGCIRITLLGRGDSELDSCGIMRWDDEKRIWMLFVYREDDTDPGADSGPRFFERNGPDSEAAWERLVDTIDWTSDPVVERGIVPNEHWPPPRRT